jgi:hypothetical protein
MKANQETPPDKHGASENRQSRQHGVDTLLRWALNHAIEDREAFLARSVNARSADVLAERASAKLLIRVYTERSSAQSGVAAAGEIMRMACQYAETHCTALLEAKKYEHGITRSISLREQYERLQQLRALRIKRWGARGD